MKKTYKFLLVAIAVMLCLVVFAACKNTKGDSREHLAAVDGGSIGYDGDLLTWAAVPNAESYTIYLNNGTEGISVTNNYMAIHLSENIRFSILAVADNTDYISAESKGSASFDYIPKVEKIEIEKRANEAALDYFVWGNVAEADYYKVRENGTSTINVTAVESEETVKTPLGYEKFQGKGGQASLQVLAVSNAANTYSHWSDAKFVTVLADPTDFGYNPDANIISWTDAENSKEYRVSMGEPTEDSELIATNWEKITGNYYIYKNGSDEREFKFCVKAIGDYDKGIVDSRIAVRSFSQMERVNGFKNEYGVLSWNPVNTASDYELRISVDRLDERGKTYTQNLVSTIVSSCNYSGIETYYNTQTVGSVTTYTPCTYTAAIRPIIQSQEAEDIVSYASWSTLSFKLLDSPELEYRGGQTVAWQQVQGAVGYEIFITKNGVSVIPAEYMNSNTRQYHFDYQVAGAGLYEVSVVALSSLENHGTNSSAKSVPMYFNVLRAPEDYSVMSDSYSVITDTIKGTDTSKGSSSEATFYFNDVPGADYYVISKSYADTFVDTNGDGKLDPVTTGSGQQTQVAIETINYEKTADNEKYQYQYNVRSIVAEATGLTQTFYMYAKTTKHDQCINNVVTLDGTDCTPIELRKLAAPSSVKLNGNILTWDATNMSSGYTVAVRNINDNNYSYVQKVYDTRYVLEISEVGEYHIYVTSLGNGSIIMDSIESNKITAVKLPAVTDLKVENVEGATSLKWTPQTATFNDVDYNPVGYKIRIGTHVEILNIQGGNISNTLNISGLLQYLTTQGTTCTVVALGNEDSQSGIVTLDSIDCKNITVFKLARPTIVSVNADALSWNGVNYADKYIVTNGELSLGEVNGTTFDITPESVNVNDYSAHEFLFKVRAARSAYHKDTDHEGSYYVESEDSAVMQVKMLQTPEVTVNSTTGMLSWPRVSEASAYLVKINDMGYNISNVNPVDTIYFKPVISAPDQSVVRISVSAIGDNVKSIDSLSFAYSTKVQKLGALNLGEDDEPFTIEVINDGNGLAKAFVIKIADAQSVNKTLGRGYYVNIGGVDTFTADGTLTIDNLAVSSYNIKVCAAGDNYISTVERDTDSTVNTMYLNGEYTAVKVINVLGAPQVNDVFVSAGGLGQLDKRVVSFQALDNAVGYTLTYTYRERTAPATMTEEAQYTNLAGYPKTITLTVGENQNGIAYIENNTVYFVISDITADVDDILLKIVVNGDGETSVSSVPCTLTYTVR